MLSYQNYLVEERQENLYHCSTLKYKIGQRVNPILRQHPRNAVRNPIKQAFIERVESFLEHERKKIGSPACNRWDCSYAWGTSKDAKSWMRKFNRLPTGIVYVVQAPISFRVNMNLADLIADDYQLYEENEEEYKEITAPKYVAIFKDDQAACWKSLQRMAADYWSGVMGQGRPALWEYLCPRGFTIVGVL
jgi:hypothetical protein